MTDHQAARGAREASVGDERDRLAQPGADDRRGHAQHLAHPRAARRALVADDEHVAAAHVPDRTASVQASSLSNTRAGPVCARALGAGELDQAARREQGCRAARRAPRPA